MEFKQVNVEEFLEVARGSIPVDRILMMLDEAENEEHKFGVSGYDPKGKAITESSFGLIIHHSMTTYFVSQADIASYFETHDRPKRPMTLAEENAYLRTKLKELEAEKAKTEVKKPPSRTTTAKQLTDLGAGKQPERPITALPERDRTIPKPEQAEDFTTDDLKKVFAKELHEKKTPSEKAQAAALKKAEEKQEKRDRLT